MSLTMRPLQPQLRCQVPSEAALPSRVPAFMLTPLAIVQFIETGCFTFCRQTPPPAASPCFTTHTLTMPHRPQPAPPAPAARPPVTGWAELNILCLITDLVNPQSLSVFLPPNSPPTPPHPPASSAHLDEAQLEVVVPHHVALVHLPAELRGAMLRQRGGPTAGAAGEDQAVCGAGWAGGQARASWARRGLGLRV